MRTQIGDQFNVMSFEDIANRLGISYDTTQRAFTSGIKKLKRRGKYELLLDTVRAIATEDKDLLQAGSIECREHDRNLLSYGGDGDV